MTEIYLDGKQVFPTDGVQFKLTVENTFFENSGSYTLDVEFPLDIEDNLAFFGPLNRVDVKKEVRKYDAMIVSNMHTILKGTAKLTEVNNSVVKVQFLSGNSSVRFWTNTEGVYIDQIEYPFEDLYGRYPGFVRWFGGGVNRVLIESGTFPGVPGEYCFVPTLDETEDEMRNLHLAVVARDALSKWKKKEISDWPENSVRLALSRQCLSPCLMYVVKLLFESLGYTIRRNDLGAMANSIYIASVRRTHATVYDPNDYEYFHPHFTVVNNPIAYALPHWTVEEFIQQLQNLFNVTFVFDDVNQKVDILHANYTDGFVDLCESITDEPEVELIADDDAGVNRYDSDIAYVKPESDHNSLQFISEDILDVYDNIECRYGEIFSKYLAKYTDEELSRCVFNTPVGRYCIKEGNEVVRFNEFGQLTRNRHGSALQLKIVPVATRIAGLDIVVAGSEHSITLQPIEGTVNTTQLTKVNGYEDSVKSSVWEAINGVENEEEKREDLIQIFLMDNQVNRVDDYYFPIQYPFTDRTLHFPCAMAGWNRHCDWSLALAHAGGQSIGALHGESRKLNRNAELRIEFESDNIPSVYSLYNIRGKQHLCKKLEITFDSEGIKRLITGYFEECI